VSVLHTIEARWFFDDQPFSETDHFAAVHQAPARCDWYALPSDDGCGIKIREGRLETKLRSKTLGECKFDESTSGIVETWSKWSVLLDPNEAPSNQLLVSTNWGAVTKLRYVRRFEVIDQKAVETLDQPANGCSFEITKLTINDRTFWTTGFEAVGLDASVQQNLQCVFKLIQTEKPLPMLTAKQSLGYPEWLNRVVDRISTHSR
jgi:hypothetical protein